jgi:transcriptional regulator with XRE-family HTH domain
MCHNTIMGSAEVVRALRGRGLTQDELARRAGIARETLSRWESGAQHPSLESLDRVAAAAGVRLEVQLVPAEPKLVELAGEQLGLDPTERLQALLDDSWPVCRDGLRAAAAVGELGVLVGPVAAALAGAPQRPGEGRVDLLVTPDDLEEAVERLFHADVHPDGFELAPGGKERRERWIAGRGQLTVRSAAAGIADVALLRDRARRFMLNQKQNYVGRVCVPLVEDLADIVECSPWSEDAIYRAGLRAVLASGRYSSRKQDEQLLQLA